MFGNPTKMSHFKLYFFFFVIGLLTSGNIIIVKNDIFGLFSNTLLRRRVVVERGED